MKDILIKTEGVCKDYLLGKVTLHVLKNIDLEIEKGSFTVILGQSGSGKSTLLNLISALDVPTKGRVFFDGKDISSLSPDQLADIRGKKVGFVFQQFNLLQQLTAIENVATPASFQGMPYEKRMEEAEKFLKMVGLGDRVDHRPMELSGGEQQRVAVARSLINDPEVVVADEPTGNVDSKTGGKILDIVKKLHKEQGRTIIVVTHDTNIADLAERIINIKDGEIVGNNVR